MWLRDFLVRCEKERKEKMDRQIHWPLLAAPNHCLPAACSAQDESRLPAQLASEDPRVNCRLQMRLPPRAFMSKMVKRGAGQERRGGKEKKKKARRPYTAK